MSSSEQAPEPTMDEILASIRKIISDDEPGETPQPEAASSMPDPADPGALADTAMPAEDGLAEDLANALNDSQVGADLGAEEADDILDLTQIVEDQPQAPEPQMEAPQMEAPQVDALQAALGDAVEAPAPQEAPGEPVESLGDVDIASVLAEAGVQDTVADNLAEPQAPAGDDPVAAQAQGDEVAAPVTEDASISEALSALEAQPGEPVAEAALQPETLAPEATEQPAVADVPEAAVAVEAPAQEDASYETGDDMMAEAPVEDAAALASALDEAAPASEAEPTSEAEPVEDTAPAEEQDMGEAAQAAPAGGAGKTLEDSVKELLRPMLREWLDDNMERIVQGEVKDMGGDKSGNA
jgi:cell pole-organizing protein PopZ